MGDVLSKGPKSGADPLAAGLQRFKAGPLLGGVDAHTRRRVMIHRDKDRHLTLLPRKRAGHIGSPHRIDLRRDDRPIMGFGSMRVPLTRGAQQLVGAHQAQHPAWRRAETAMAQPCPHLTVPFAGERRRFQDTPDMVAQLVIWTGTNGPSSGARRRGRMPLPVERGAGHAPHAAEARQAIRLASGGRGGLAHRLDLLGGKGRLVSSRPICSGNNSISIVDSPSFSRRRPSSRSRLSRGMFFIASWPASRNASRQAARGAAGMPSSRDSRSSASPRRRRNTTSVLRRAENRSAFCHPFWLPSPVALQAPCEGTSMEISCVCIWTPPLSDYTQGSVQSNCTPNQGL